MHPAYTQGLYMLIIFPTAVDQYFLKYNYAYACTKRIKLRTGQEY